MTYTLSPDDIKRCRSINMRYRDRVKEIALAVSAETSIPISTIYGKSRRRDVVQARWLVMHLAAQEGMNRTDIGLAMNMDQSSVRHGLAKERERRAGDPACHPPLFVKG